MVRFAFRDIYLPFADSINDGWVRFAVRTVAEPTLRQEVRNSAAIYFDQNPPIYTNTVRDVYFESSGFAEAELPDIAVRAHPNPTSGDVTPMAEGEVLAVQVYDTRGAVQLSPKPATTVAFGSLPAGGVRAARDDGGRGWGGAGDTAVDRATYPGCLIYAPHAPRAAHP